MSDTTALLVAERDGQLRDDLVGQLVADGYQTHPARTGAEARCRAGHDPDLLLLGELDDSTGALRLLRELRSGDALASRADPALPVIVLCADRGEWAPLRALEAGADDCVRKPVGYLELRARVGAVLRRTKRTLAESPRRVGALALDPMRHEVRFAGRPLALARTSTCCSATWRPSPSACSQSASCCATSGATGPRPRPGRSTPTPAACGKSSPPGAVGHVVNRRGVGYRLVDRVPAPIDQGVPGAAASNGSGSLIELGGTRRVA
jgi:DNA-binding response OmpR family regulator